MKLRNKNCKLIQAIKILLVIPFVENCLKINPTQSQTSIRMNLNKSESNLESKSNIESESIRTRIDLHRILNPNEPVLELIRIRSIGFIWYESCVEPD